MPGAVEIRLDGDDARAQGSEDCGHGAHICADIKDERAFKAAGKSKTSSSGAIAGLRGLRAAVPRPAR